MSHTAETEVWEKKFVRRGNLFVASNTPECEFMLITVAPVWERTMKNAMSLFLGYILEFI